MNKIADFKRMKTLAGGTFVPFIRYNLKLVFGGKFRYFLGVAVLIFIGLSLVRVFGVETRPSEADAFTLVLLSSLLVVFYPSAFSIQNDMDARMIEILFGIPDYRYKVWLVRLIVMWVVTTGIDLILGTLFSVLVVDVPLVMLTMHVLVPTVCIASAVFMISTLVKSGNATAVIIVIVILGLWVFREPVQDAVWFPFLNPYAIPTDMPESIWADRVMYNRLSLTVGAAVFLLWGLFNLQNRERYVS